MKLLLISTSSVNLKLDFVLELISMVNKLLVRYEFNNSWLKRLLQLDVALLLRIYLWFLWVQCLVVRSPPLNQLNIDILPRYALEHHIPRHKITLWLAQPFVGRNLACIYLWNTFFLKGDCLCRGFSIDLLIIIILLVGLWVFLIFYWRQTGNLASNFPS